MGKCYDEMKKRLYAYTSEMRKLDDPSLSDEERNKLADVVALRALDMSYYAGEIALELDTVRESLFTKWWYKLFTKLHL